ncbi:glyoxylate/hydroxypyruvate reductase A [Paracidovorax citrulli]|uniref:D-isomer specific 2-hydroxyacid dehydrogenase, NAD-binding protein n=2 Tax=Paracidovorax citrulli TaxID=80869 RepID=A1TTL7_PARC0|nr:glyoxylate/hydroxypyruvate reductase A [Paracidovorax citrulli]ABM34305.1 D-isomer specific 2-hydroxyacid dehydrogenase, NAD-binding protein [Paracidovorax citrulli AAC00-1]ATG93789.1 glyoxylate/hydroxypyruvate reductase A [Paracidovorax citrulli]MVT27962.1 glyoxylate/hydroxypyruvate reductase A [Paracidovorax citrulli]MVT37159.1 glyoxylate/hydroxypyruvate reductase A [Paracidovorax citrulli]PVY63747.1 glyoxylate/hydroxypyruvate reductase A [Paracidovorax citrulli]
MAVLYRPDVSRGPAWRKLFAEQAPDIDFRVWPDAGNLDEIEYLIAWQAPAAFLASLSNLKVLFSSGAGVDHIDLTAVPAHVDIVRMVEPGIINGMVEYVTMAVLAQHRHLFDYQASQRARRWEPLEELPPSTCSVGVMGLGVLGQAVLDRLGLFGFERSGWNRSPRDLPGVRCFAGTDSLGEFLGQVDVLVCLLPLTDATRHILDARLFARMRDGSALVNVGRGGHLDQQALLQALDSGRLSRAILDVTDPEPLPAESPLWSHPRVVLTPHIASMTQPETAVPILIRNLRRHGRGQPLPDLIDRRAGY